MNLVTRYNKISTAILLKKQYNFRVVPFREGGKYCISYSNSRDHGLGMTGLLDKQSVAYVMQKALQYKVGYQDRIVFKIPYEEIQYDLQDIIVFKSQKQAETALLNFLLYAIKRHGSLVKDVLNIAFGLYSPF